MDFGAFATGLTKGIQRFTQQELIRQKLQRAAELDELRTKLQLAGFDLQKDRFELSQNRQEYERLKDLGQDINIQQEKQADIKREKEDVEAKYIREHPMTHPDFPDVKMTVSEYTAYKKATKEEKPEEKKPSMTRKQAMDEARKMWEERPEAWVTKDIGGGKTKEFLKSPPKDFMVAKTDSLLAEAGRFAPGAFTGQQGKYADEFQDYGTFEEFEQWYQGEIAKGATFPEDYYSEAERYYAKK